LNWSYSLVIGETAPPRSRPLIQLGTGCVTRILFSSLGCTLLLQLAQVPARRNDFDRYMSDVSNRNYIGLYRWNGPLWKVCLCKCLQQFESKKLWRMFALLLIAFALWGAWSTLRSINRQEFLSSNILFENFGARTSWLA
jgi:hypothetical protein